MAAIGPLMVVLLLWSEEIGGCSDWCVCVFVCVLFMEREKSGYFWVGGKQMRIIQLDPCDFGAKLTKMPFRPK